MIVRMFDTSVDPADIERGIQLFRDQVKPVFEAFDGCRGIEMLISVEEHSADLVEIAAVSRWDSKDAIERATKTPEYETALAEIRTLFVQTPIIRHFETVD